MKIWIQLSRNETPEGARRTGVHVMAVLASVLASGLNVLTRQSRVTADNVIDPLPSGRDPLGRELPDLA